MPEPKATLPFVSVLMPVRDEAAYIERSLGAVLGQAYPPDRFEVIVLDGLSGDDTQARVERLAEAHPAIALTLLGNPARTAPHAMNLGLRHAHGDVIVRVDGHCEIAPDYLRRCAVVLAETGADCVGGVMTTVGETPTAQTIARAQSHPFGVGGAGFRIGGDRGRWVDTVAFGAYRRAVFARIGGFDEELVRNQDDEFNFRLLQSGGRIWLDPSIRVTYFSRAAYGRLWRQYFQYGVYKIRVMQKRGGVASWRHLVPALFVAAVVGALALTAATGAVGFVGAVLGPYLVGLLGASLHAARGDLGALLRLPLAFLVLHFAYGFGTWAGLWRWRRYFFDQASETASP